MLGYASTVRAAMARTSTRTAMRAFFDMAVLLLRTAAGRDRRRLGVEIDAHDHFVLHADAQIRRLGDTELRYANRKARVQPVAVPLRLDVGRAGHVPGLAVQQQRRAKRRLAGQLLDTDVAEARLRERGAAFDLEVFPAEVIVAQPDAGLERLQIDQEVAVERLRGIGRHPDLATQCLGLGFEAAADRERAEDGHLGVPDAQLRLPVGGVLRARRERKQAEPDEDSGTGRRDFLAGHFGFSLLIQLVDVPRRTPCPWWQTFGETA